MSNPQTASEIATAILTFPMRNAHDVTRKLRWDEHRESMLATLQLCTDEFDAVNVLQAARTHHIPADWIVSGRKADWQLLQRLADEILLEYFSHSGWCPSCLLQLLRSFMIVYEWRATGGGEMSEQQKG